MNRRRFLKGLLAAATVATLGPLAARRTTDLVDDSVSIVRNGRIGSIDKFTIHQGHSFRFSIEDVDFASPPVNKEALERFSEQMATMVDEQLIAQVVRRG